MSDDLGYETLGCNGGTSYNTPALNELAETGARFESAHVQPLCTPTRVQLMTGKYNFRNYIGFGLIDPSEITFGHIFRNSGYKTCIAGKWQLYSYSPLDESPELRNKGQKIEDSGFDEYCVWHAHHTEEKGSRYKDPVIYQNGKYLTNTENKYGDDIFCDYILDFAKRNQTKNFFAYFPMALTHRPFEPTPDSPEWEEFESYTNTSESKKGRNFDTVEGWDDNPKYYKDMVEYHDKIIGRLIEGLEKLGLREDTLIIYVGDNGSPQEVCSIMHKHDEVCGGKGLTKDTGTHVPLICNQPGTISPMVSDDLIDSTDFLPTIIEATKINSPENFQIDGRSFYPQLLGNKGNPRDWIFFHFDPMSPRSITSKSPAAAKPLIRFIRSKKWKLYEDGRLYNMTNDRDEETPFLSANDNTEKSEIRQSLKNVLKNMK
tara:strand:+ start:309 stop:1601 length:1293 start_codon:yes stop_codon:yes gene_type:complete